MNMMHLAVALTLTLFAAGVTSSTANAGGIAKAAARAAMARTMLAKEAARDASAAAVRSQAPMKLARANTVSQAKHGLQPVRQVTSKTGKPAQAIISRGRYPETAAHIKEAQRLGQPSVLTIDRAGATERRRESLRYLERRAGRQIVGRDRDEYPPAMTREGGFNSDVRYVRAADNRGAGKSFERQMRTLPEGARVRILIGE